MSIDADNAGHDKSQPSPPQQARSAEQRKAAARAVSLAADERDADADARDLVAERRDYDGDLAAFLDPDTAEYERGSRARHDAATDRANAKSDRLSAAQDRASLTKDQ